MTEWDELEWARPFGSRCRAVKPVDRGELYWGRCDLRPGHEGRHALERGMDIVYWSTREFIADPLIDGEMRSTLRRIVGTVTDYQPFLPVVVDDLMRYFDAQRRAIADHVRWPFAATEFVVVCVVDHGPDKHEVAQHPIVYRSEDFGDAGRWLSRHDHHYPDCWFRLVPGKPTS